MSEKQTVLLIGPTPPPYHGVAQVTEALLNSKLEEYFNIAHLDISDRRGIEFVDKPDLYDVFIFLKQWAHLLKILLKSRPSVVYIPLSQSTVGFIRDSFFIWPSVVSGGRVILHLHGGNFRTWYENRSWIEKAYVRRVFQNVEKVIVLGESLKVLFEGLVASQKISVVPNGIPKNNESTHSNKMLCGSGRFRILYLGTLNHYKGVLVMLSSISIVVKSRQDVEFIFAGSWYNKKDQEEADSIIANGGLYRFVSFVGLVKGQKKDNILKSSDIFVFPGIQQEGQPLVVLEAMAAGLPILFTNRGCLRETVREGENGLEILPDDPNDLAAKILWLLDHPLKMKQMGVQSRFWFEKCYTMDHFTENMACVFNDLAKD